MMLKIKTSLLSLTALIFAVCLVACKENKEPVEVAVYQMEYGSGRLEITALADKVTISNIEVNRGNCGDGYLYKRKHGSMADTLKDIEPKSHILVFGQKLSVPIYGCSVKEVEIETDEDTYTFTFDPA